MDRAAARRHARDLRGAIADLGKAIQFEPTGTKNPGRGAQVASRLDRRTRGQRIRALGEKPTVSACTLTLRGLRKVLTSAGNVPAYACGDDSSDSNRMVSAAGLVLAVGVARPAAAPDCLVAVVAFAPRWDHGRGSICARSGAPVFAVPGAWVSSAQIVLVLGFSLFLGSISILRGL